MNDDAQLHNAGPRRPAASAQLLPLETLPQVWGQGQPPIGADPKR